MSEQVQARVYVCGEWEIDLVRRELRHQGLAVPLGGRAFEILAELAKSAGELITKSDLLQRVWPGVFVEEIALRVHVAAIRRALGDDRELLETTIGRGYRLRGIWHAREESEALAIPKPASPGETDLPSTNIPVATSGLIGRAAILPHLQGLLSAYRIVTLTGPGGIGKTVLALDLARSVLHSFQGLGFLVEFAPLADPRLVSSTVATVLGLKLVGEEDAEDAVVRAIAHRRLLLVLDNCEHVVDAAASFSEAIVSRCPNVHVLATSREMLRIEGEYVYRVPPLDLPSGDWAEGPPVQGGAAAELFMARARALGREFGGDRETLRAIAAICRRLDGIPLAIEFAAARAAMLGPPAVAESLDDRFNLLTTGRRTALPRHRTLRAALDWSYELLPESEARTLRFLSVFAGEFPLAAAMAVEDEGTIPITDGIANLVAKSLMTVDLAGDSPKYRLLDTTRVYALEKLRKQGEYREAARRHARYFRNYFANAERESESRPLPDWLAIYGQHLDNVRLALDWAFSPDGDAQIGVELVAVAVPIWVQLSLLAECRNRVQLALERLDDRAAGAERLRMQLSAALGWSLMYGFGRASQAGPAWATALELAERLGDRDYLLRALWGLSINQLNDGQFRRALEFAHRFREVADGSDDPIELIMTDRLLATALHYLGEQDLARDHIDRVVSRLNTFGYEPRFIRFRFDLRISTHYFLARILWLQGLAEQALGVVARNLVEGRNGGHALTLCSVLGQAAGPIAFLAGDLDTAGAYCAELLDHTRRHPIRLWQLWAECFQGLVMAKRGGTTAGLAMLGTALEKAGDAQFLPRFLLPLGEYAACLGKAGDVARGLAIANNALVRCEGRDDFWYWSELERIRGELLLQLDGGRRVAEAEQCFDKAIDLARRQGARFWELRGAMSLARLRIAQDRPTDARDLLLPVYRKFTEGFDVTADLRDARSMLAALPE
ncbi:ATP-binding protein [Bradyrhizobium sp. STM 3557]|uniref:ATP-binding protein n=1 Tax=Bradyrhizobium sp. STM 3557 TaxID=578920 RepID=UPI00388E0D16